MRIGFEWDRLNPTTGRKKGYDPLSDGPRFMALDANLEETLILSQEVQYALDIGLFAPIEHSDACRQHNVPLKRGVLLAGPYGTGKTLTASVTATKGTRSGWTFIYLDDVRDLKRGLEFASQYAPAVLFAEDIDRVVRGERTTSVDEILNTIDGVDTKNGEIITVFTTNHAEEINDAMLRPGRIDVFVEFTPPDATAAARLVTLYSRGLLEPGADLDRIGQKLQGKIAAFIRETVERAKIAAISRLGSANIHGLVRAEDLLAAATAMENHNNLVFGKNQNNGSVGYEVHVTPIQVNGSGRAPVANAASGD